MIQIEILLMISSIYRKFTESDSDTLSVFIIVRRDTNQIFAYLDSNSTNSKKVRYSSLAALARPCHV